MNTKLRNITLKGFRGATREATLSFAPDKKITMVFGENGTGKSSLVDAFAFACEKSIGSLQDRSGGRIGHLASVAVDPKDLRVTLVSSSGTWLARLDGSSIAVTPPNGCPPVRILRRARITRLIEADPKDRFDELRAFIAVPGIEACEKTLREGERTADRNLRSHIASLTQASSGLTAYWEKEGKPGKDALEWATKQKGQDVTALERNVSSIKGLLDQLRDLETKKADLAQKNERVAKAKEAHTKALAEQEGEEKKLVNRNADLVTLLQQANAYVSKTKEVPNCPVCSSPIDRKTLLDSLSARIREMGALTAAKATAEAQAKVVQSATDNHALARADFVIDARASIESLLNSTLTCLEGVAIDRARMKATEAESEAETIVRAELLLGLVVALRTALSGQSKAESATIERRNAIVTYLEQIERADKAKNEADALLKGLGRALAIVEGTRKDYVTSVLQEISQEVDRLYGYMHPDESLNGLRLYLKPKVQGSLELHGNFHTETDVAPQAYFSESHLDTLGLCIFVALAKKYKTEDTIVILDDVVTSVDSTHLERFINLVDTECVHFNHVIITTHYRPWRERYRYHQAANSKMSFVELRGWSLKEGISIFTTKLAVDDLAEVLEPKNFQRQSVASTSGILLEGLLDNLSLRYSLKIARKQPPTYTLGEFIAAFDSKFVQQLKIERFENGSLSESIEIKPLFESLRDLTWIRNQVGAHFNKLGEEISDVDVRKFGEATLALARALICPVSGEIPNRNRSGSCWESAEGRTCLHPLTVPGARPSGE